MPDERYDDATFGEFLLKSNLVKPGRPAHLVRWAGLFFRLKRRWPNYLWHEPLEFFTGYLGKERNLP